MRYGIVTVSSAVPAVRVADSSFNEAATEELIIAAERAGAEIVCFPELGLTGYSCGDLFFSGALIAAADTALRRLAAFTADKRVTVVVGLPVACGAGLYNCAAVIHRGIIAGVVAKTFLPNYGEFYEERWFAAAADMTDTDIIVGGQPVRMTATPQLFVTPSGVTFGVEICEDLWAPVSPGHALACAGADIILNLSASDETVGKHAYLRALVAMQSAQLICGYVYAGCGFGESTQDVVYGGVAMVYENGRQLAEGARFSTQPQLCTAQIDTERLRAERRRNNTFISSSRGACADTVRIGPAPGDHTAADDDFVLTRNVDPLPFVPRGEGVTERCREILAIQTMGLAKRLEHIGCRSAVVGISGGLDSTLALLVCVRAFDTLHIDRRGIIGVTMPGFGTTDRTHDNALRLMASLGITAREISISQSVLKHFEDIGHDPAVHDVTYENSQARERTQILMDTANMCGGIVVGTGDLSELALGWATFNGDHMSMYGVNAGVPKTLVRHIVTHIADNYVDDSSRRTLHDIIDTPISPELLPADEQGRIRQKTEDIVGPYELHDFFLYHFLRFGYTPTKIFALARKAFDGSDTRTEHYDDATIKHWLRVFVKRFFAQQFKRSCMPDGPKVGSVSLSPRGDWRMPSDATPNEWMTECDNL